MRSSMKAFAAVAVFAGGILSTSAFAADAEADGGNLHADVAQACASSNSDLGGQLKCVMAAAHSLVLSLHKLIGEESTLPLETKEAIKDFARQDAACQTGVRGITALEASLQEDSSKIKPRRLHRD